MWLGESYADTEITHVDTGTDRKARQKTTFVCRHVGACFVIVSYAYVKFLTWHEIGSKNEMTHKIRHERVFE